jgi:hypothetical protein
MVIVIPENPIRRVVNGTIFTVYPGSSLSEMALR